MATGRSAVTSAAPAAGPLGSGDLRDAWWRSRWLRAAGSLAVVALIFGFFFPKLADYGEVWQTITAMTLVEVATLTAVALVSLASYWPMLTAWLPALRLREAAVANLASTAVANTLPGGGAIGIAVTMTMQRSWGIPVADTTLATVMSGVWNNFVKLGLPVIAVGLLVVSGGAGAALAPAALVGLALLAAAIGLLGALLRSERTAARIGAAAGRVATALRRLVRRGPVEGWDRRAVGFRVDVVGLLGHRWLRITVTTVVSQLSLYAVLLVAVRTVGVGSGEVSWQVVLAAFTFVRLLSAVPITPGGLGVIELGLTATMGAGLSTAATSRVAAAVLLFRAFTWLVPIPLGVGCWVFWRTNLSWRRSVAARR